LGGGGDRAALVFREWQRTRQRLRFTSHVGEVVAQGNPNAASCPRIALQVQRSVSAHLTGDNADYIAHVSGPPQLGVVAPGVDVEVLRLTRTRRAAGLPPAALCIAMPGFEDVGCERSAGVCAGLASLLLALRAHRRRLSVRGALLLQYLKETFGLTD